MKTFEGNELMIKLLRTKPTKSSIFADRESTA